MFTMSDWGFFPRIGFSCKCGCGFNTVDVELLEICSAVREFLGVPVIINSGCRCKEHNAEVGGASHSQHLLGRAADLRVKNPAEVYSFLCDTFPGRYGFIQYPSFVHVDSRDKAYREVK